MSCRLKLVRPSLLPPWGRCCCSHRVSAQTAAHVQYACLLCLPTTTSYPLPGHGGSHIAHMSNGLKETPSFPCSTHRCALRSGFSIAPSPPLGSLNSHIMPELPGGLWVSCSLSNKNLQSGDHSKKRRGKKGKGMTTFSEVNVPLRKQFSAKLKALRSIKLTWASKYLLIPPTQTLNPGWGLWSSLPLLLSQRPLTGAGKGGFSSCQNTIGFLFCFFLFITLAWIYLYHTFCGKDRLLGKVVNWVVSHTCECPPHTVRALLLFSCSECKSKHPFFSS